MTSSPLVSIYLHAASKIVRCPFAVNTYWINQNAPNVDLWAHEVGVNMAMGVTVLS